MLEMNGNRLYNVCLDNHQDEVVKRFIFFLENERFVDVNIKCGNKNIKVHKIVLVANSEYFQEILCEDYLQLTLSFKAHYSIIFPLIEFIYYGKTLFSETSIKYVVSAAKFLGIKGLSSIDFEDSDELPTFFPPDITEIKWKTEKIPSCLIHSVAIPKNVQNGIILKVPFKATNENLEYFDDDSSEDYDDKLKTHFKKRRGKKTKQHNPRFTLAVVNEMSRELEHSSYLFQYLKMFLEDKTEDQCLEKDIVYSPENYYTEDLIKEFPEQNGKNCQVEYINENYNDEFKTNSQNVDENFAGLYEHDTENIDKNQSFIFNDDENVTEYEIIDQSDDMFMIE